jgi:hypothetical protein
MKHTKRRIGIIATSVAAVLIGGGVAVAFWTTSGNGTGSAAVGTTGTVTIAQTNTVGGLYPGGPAQALQFSVTNNGSSPVVVSNVTVAIDPATSNFTGTCTAGDFALTQGSATGQPVNPGAGNAVTQAVWGGGWSTAMLDSGSNQNDCKGATVGLKYTSN